MSSSNFQFLSEKWNLLYQLGKSAEQHLYQDPHSTVVKLRIFAESLAKHICAMEEIEDKHIPQHKRIQLLYHEQLISKEINDIFHLIRRKGNPAAHEPVTYELSEVKTLLQLAFRLATWFMEVYGEWNFQPPIYHEPQPKEMIEKAELQKLVDSYEQKLSQMEQKYQQLRQDQLHVKQAEKTARRKKLKQLGMNLNLTEEETRVLIDEQLRQAGWEVNSGQLRYSLGARPAEGKNRAIAEWPLKRGFADYALFIGLELVGIIEAKRASKDIPSDIEQAKRYARAVVKHENEVIHEPWGDYFVPFLFATNGRPYMRQLEQKSGIWFLDARKATNHPRAIADWYTPKGLKRLMEQNKEQAEQRLKAEQFDYLGLRDYQVKAIQSVEAALANNQRNLLVSMATGTGKTRMAIGLIYRLIKAKRFYRILFLVDREALGEQAEKAFQDSKLESFHTFTEIYELQSLKDKNPNPETKVQIATVQGMLRRIMYNEKMEEIPSVDQYDCIVVDEAHRGYILDRDMSEKEIKIRDHKDYVSKYRQVLDHFDAVKIGLTATPALHTTEIFGKPIFQYSYREAVTDGYLIDHELPYQMDTKLKRDGIHFKKGEEVDVYHQSYGIVETEVMEDEVDIEIDSFHTKVVTENFNRTIIQKLTDYISPFDQAKTLIFAATNDHADLVVKILKEEFMNQYGEVEDNAIMKITGSIDNPSQAIKRFKNERMPSIVVTVDLLTTGIDVPQISHLVFLRRVKSRILYEQMLGRATRPCPEIGKDRFFIYDAVGIYEVFQPVTQMKPIVVNPKTTLIQLVEEFDLLSEENELEQQRDQILAKLQRKKRKMNKKRKQAFKSYTGGERIGQFINRLRECSLHQLGNELKKQKELFYFLDQKQPVENKKYISTHEDELLSVTRGYGKKGRPEDYLESFGRFIQENMNQIPALMLVCQRPNELKREDLKELVKMLDEKGFTATSLQGAWRDVTNQDIAAGIIAFIRQQALGDPLISHEQRIEQAMKPIYEQHAWTPVQRNWLEKIEMRLKNVYDLHLEPEKTFEEEPFRSDGGYRRVNQYFKGKLKSIIHEITTNVYQTTKGKAQ